MDYSKKNSLVAFFIWFCITLFYCYQYVLRVIPNIIMPDIMNMFNIGATEYGSFAGIYYIGYIAMHIPIGIMFSRFGVRNILPICILLTGLGLAPVIYSNNWYLVLFGRFLTGVGSSAAIVGALQIYRLIYPETFTRMLGVSISLSLITVVYAGKPLATFIIFFGLEQAINLVLLGGVGIALATFILMPKSTSESNDSNMFDSIKQVMSNYKILITSLLAGLMVGPMEGFADAWGSAFLVQVYGFEKVAADVIVLAIFLGMCSGCIVMPYVADKTQGYYSSTIFAGIIMALSFVYLLSLKADQDLIYYTCFIIGFFCSYQVIIIAKISTFVSPEKSGMAASIANMIIMAFGWVFHNSIGFILDNKWEGKVSAGIKIYSADAFISSLSIIPIAICLAVIGIFIVSIFEKKNCNF